MDHGVQLSIGLLLLRLYYCYGYYYYHVKKLVSLYNSVRVTEATKTAKVTVLIITKFQLYHCRVIRVLLTGIHSYRNVLTVTINW